MNPTLTSHSAAGVTAAVPVLPSWIPVTATDWAVYRAGTLPETAPSADQVAFQMGSFLGKCLENTFSCLLAGQVAPAEAAKACYKAWDEGIEAELRDTLSIVWGYGAFDTEPRAIAWATICRVFTAPSNAARVDAYGLTSAEATLTDEQVFRSAWPAGIDPATHYRVLCDDKGRNEGTWLKVMFGNDGDAYVSMQDWENVPEGNPDPFPSLRVRTFSGGGRNHRTHQALLWLAQAIRLDEEEIRNRQSQNGH